MELRPIEGYPDYQVDDEGNVYSRRRERAKGGKLKPVLNVHGYLTVTLMPGRNVQLVHRLIAKAFLSNPDDLPVVNHKDGCKTNNRKENLEWCTQADNIAHSTTTGLLKTGERRTTAKLTQIQADLMRKIYKTKSISQVELAKMFGVSKNAVYQILSNKTYKPST